MEKIKKKVQRKLKLVENQQGNFNFVVDTDASYNFKVLLNSDSKNLGYYNTHVGEPVIQNFSLTIIITGTGSGDVNVDGVVYDSVLTYSSGSVVELSAVVEGDNEFIGWSGDITSDNPNAVVVMDSDKIIYVTINDASVVTNILTINDTGDGTGDVTVNGDPYTFGTTLSFAENEEVTVVVTEDTNSMFFGWSGDITPSTDKTQTITMDINKVISCQFDLPFILKIDTEIDEWYNDEPGVVKLGGVDMVLQLGLESDGYNYDFLIDWGDNNVEYYTQAQVNLLEVNGTPPFGGRNCRLPHTYATPGQYRIKISGIFGGVRYEWQDYSPNILEIQQWGKIVWDDCEVAFTLADNLEITATDIPDFSQVYSCDMMFNSGASLSSINTPLFSNCSATTMYDMFVYNKQLSIINKDIFKNCSNVENLRGVFANCELSLLTVDKDLFKDCINVTNMIGVFSSCFSLISIPEDIFKYNVLVEDFALAFNACRSLTYIPDGLFRNNINVTNFFRTFSGCNTLTDIPSDLFDNNTLVTNFNGCFRSCDNLTTIPQDIINPTNHPNVLNLSYVFKNLPSITGNSPNVWKDAPLGYGANPSGIITTSCFTGSSGFTDYNSIPAAWGGGA